MVSFGHDDHVICPFSRFGIDDQFTSADSVKAIAYIFNAHMRFSVIQLFVRHEARTVVDGIRRDIAVEQGKADEFRAKLDAASAQVNVGYEAAQMGMISARGVEVIRIVLPPVFQVDLDQITGTAP